MKTALVAQGIHGALTLEVALAEAVPVGFDRLDVAVAYATKQGVRALELALGAFPANSRWVVGLDDAITQPEALAYLFALPGAELRLVALAPERRFHPKLYCMWRSDDETVAATAVGSGNMTLRGLRHNGETAVLLTAEAKADANALKAQWKAMWSLGKPATQPDIDDYATLYKKAKKQRQKIVDLGVAPPEPKIDAAIDPVSTFNGDPTTATVAWTEGASPSAGGRDLEFPRAMMPFFALNGAQVQRRFRALNGQQFHMTFTYRAKNDMWRLMFSRVAIEAAIGRESLRPVAGGNRSDLAIIFAKIANSLDYDLRMAVIGSADHSELLARSAKVDGLHSTKGAGSRNFGFF